MNVSQRVLITGGAGAIGSAIAARSIEDGYEPVIIDRVGDGIIADLADPAELDEALQEALRGGPVNRLVNCAAIIRAGSVEDVTLDDIGATWSVNVRAAVQCMKAVLPNMKAEGFGRVVNITSRGSLGRANRTAYSSTKAALVGLTRSWALELAGSGITVNAIGPGPIRTPLLESVNPPGSDALAALVAAVPVGRLGEPAEVAHSVSHLLDRRTSFVTGQTLFVCGGLTTGTAVA